MPAALRPRANFVTGSSAFRQSPERRAKNVASYGLMALVLAVCLWVQRRPQAGKKERRAHHG